MAAATLIGIVLNLDCVESNLGKTEAEPCWALCFLHTASLCEEVMGCIQWGTNVMFGDSTGSPWVPATCKAPAVMALRGWGQVEGDGGKPQANK